VVRLERRALDPGTCDGLEPDHPPPVGLGVSQSVSRVFFFESREVLHTLPPLYVEIGSLLSKKTSVFMLKIDHLEARKGHPHAVGRL
jgi:hypothetical protein